MTPPMHIVFCADRRVLPGLHVAAWSLLDAISVPVSFHFFSDALTEADLALLRQTLEKTGKPFQMELRRVEAKALDGFPTLNNSLAAYYRLLVPRVMEVDRFLYVDADTLCRTDVASLNTLPLGDAPVGLVPEAPMNKAVDRGVAELLGNSPNDPYFNSGVMLVDVAAWLAQKITEKAMDCIKEHPPTFWDQSALNIVLHRRAAILDERFNCISNMRKHWPALRNGEAGDGRLFHFVDYPKPWDLFGEWINPHYRLWRAALEQTALNGFRSWHATPARKFPSGSKSWIGYKKSLKDRLLFTGYANGWLKHVKGVPAQ